jgi:hypothetical protein
MSWHPSAEALAKTGPQVRRMSDTPQTRCSPCAVRPKPGFFTIPALTGLKYRRAAANPGGTTNAGRFANRQHGCFGVQSDFLDCRLNIFFLFFFHHTDQYFKMLFRQNPFIFNSTNSITQ